MNQAIVKLAEAEINRAVAAMKELVATAENDNILLIAIQNIGISVTTEVNKNIAEMRGQQRVHKMVQGGKEALKQKPEPQLDDVVKAMKPGSRGASMTNVVTP